MASSLRMPVSSIVFGARPGFSIIPPYSPVSQQCRAFSQSPQRWAYRTKNFSPPSMSMPSLKNRQKEALMNNLPNDIGLLPGTFVRPVWKDRPSIFKNPRDWWMMEWTSIKGFFQNYVSLGTYCFKDMKVPLLLRERRTIAERLHSQMYTALARGDIPALRHICCDGLAKKLAVQIEKRPMGEKVTWKLVSWLRQPSTFFTGLRVVSDRATQIHEVPNSGVRQMVVRMTTRQSKSTSTPARARGKASKAETPAKEQDCHEYIVVQQIIWRGKASGWRVWGHTKPTDIDRIYNDPHFQPGLSLVERMEAIRSSTGQK